METGSFIKDKNEGFNSIKKGMTGIRFGMSVI